jgi:hypothetical protein
VRISGTAAAKWIPANNNPRRQFMAARVHLMHSGNQNSVVFEAGENLIALQKMEHRAALEWMQKDRQRRQYERIFGLQPRGK